MESRRGTSLLIVLVLVHLVVISHQVDRGGNSLLEKIIFGAISPVQNLVAAGVHGLSSTWHGYIDLRGIREENAQMRGRLRELELLLQEKEELAREGEQLRALTGLQEKLTLKTVVAEVVARDGVPWFRTFTINKGTKHGLELSAPVLSPTGVVGRIIGLGPYAAKVQLLLDRDASVGVQLARTGVTGITAGQVGLADSGSRDLVVKYIPITADVQVMDAVITSGLDQIYPKGLMVGRVTRIGGGSGLFKEIYVTPSTRFEEIEDVLVASAEKTDLSTPESVH